MLPIRVVPAALLVAALCVAAAAPAAAGPAAGFMVPRHASGPSARATGDRVTLTMPGCRTTAYAFSALFDPVRLRDGRAAAAVERDAPREVSYRVVFRCGHATRTAGLRLPAPAARHARTAGPSTAPALSAAVLEDTLPGPVRAGLGGSIGGVSTGELATGTALVVASLTATVYVVRRRARNR
jgi:hypothetical protein